MSDKESVCLSKEASELRELLHSSKYLKNCSDDKAVVALASKVSIVIKEMVTDQSHEAISSILREELMKANVKDVMEMMKVVNIVIRRTEMGIVKAFEQKLIQIVEHIWIILKEADLGKDATILKAMRWGWPSLFPFKILHELDHALQDVDNSWPIWPLSLSRMEILACKRCRQLTSKNASKLEPTGKIPEEKPIRLEEDRQALMKSLQRIKNKYYRKRALKLHSNSADDYMSLACNSASEGISSIKIKLRLEHDNPKKMRLSKCQDEDIIG